MKKADCCFLPKLYLLDVQQLKILTFWTPGEIPVQYARKQHLELGLDWCNNTSQPTGNVFVMGKCIAV